MHGFRQRLDNVVSSVEATAVLHNIHTMMRIEEGEEEEDDDDNQDQDERRRRRRLANENDAGNSSSDEDDGAQPPRQSKKAIREEGQAIRDSILSSYFDGEFWNWLIAREKFCWGERASKNKFVLGTSLKTLFIL